MKYGCVNAVHYVMQILSLEMIKRFWLNQQIAE